MKKSTLTLALLAFVIPVFCQPDFSLEPASSGLSRITDITNCRDERLFVLERDGRIRIIEADGTVLPTPFLDINPRVNSNQSEQGLLGLAFHPDYLNNGYFYVYYIDNGEDTQVSRFSVSANDPNVADPDSELKILDTGQPFWNHNGGCIKFGPDGYLYISLGDGGSFNDPQANGQNRQTFLGKMLRIDVNNGDPYTIPADNPFANDDFTLDEIWALGLRNAWRFSFDAVTGDLWLGDVGQNQWEEIDYQPASSPGGENYGWRCYEGDHAFNTGGCEPMSNMTFPVFEYPNGFTDGCSVTGGFVYRGCEMPALYGHYIFADFCSGKFWSITPDGTDWKTVELANLSNNNFSSFGENSAGELFVVGHGDGSITKVTSDSGILNPTSETCEGEVNGSITIMIPTDQFMETTWNDGSTEVTRSDLMPGMYSVEITTTNGCVFTEEVEIAAGLPYPDQPVINVVGNGELSTDATNASYQWYLNGDLIAGATDATYMANESGNYSVVVANANGCETTSEVVNVTVTVTLEQLGLEQVQLTPNPFDNNLQLKLMSTQNTELEILLSDASGRLIRRDLITANGFFERTYQLQDLSAGVYFFTVKNEKGEWSERVVKK